MEIKVDKGVVSVTGSVLWTDVEDGILPVGDVKSLVVMESGVIVVPELTVSVGVMEEVVGGVEII